MSHRPYKPTEILRTTLVQEIATILPPVIDAPAGSYRRVQVVVPASPSVYVDADKDPEDLGLNRSYKMPVFSPGQQLRFALLPTQSLIAASKEGYAEVSLIVEHFIDPQHREG